DRLCYDLKHGTCQAPTFLAPALARRLSRRGRPYPQRAASLQAIFRSSLPLADKLRQAWPRLALISCWGDAAAAACLNEVRALFPGIEIQPKGLLATEGCVSFPLIDRAAPILAVRSHFFEFEELDGDNSRCRFAHELDRGGRYRVVITTAGGLYRYQLR